MIFYIAILFYKTIIPIFGIEHFVHNVTSFIFTDLVMRTFMQTRRNGPIYLRNVFIQINKNNVPCKPVNRFMPKMLTLEFICFPQRRTNKFVKKGGGKIFLFFYF